jgi:uncharacterized protein (DUF1015 family)
MANVAPFHGLRYDLGHVGALADVVAPPYDVIDSKMQDALYKRHPANVVRLILNRSEPGDENDDAKYDRAARFLKNWKQEGILRPDAQPAFYLYQQVFSYSGSRFTRSGFMGRVRLEPFGEGRIFPHEETHAAAKADRLKLTNACRTNLSPIFGIYPDPENEVISILQNATLGTPPLTVMDEAGVEHRLWVVTDPEALRHVARLMGPHPVFIADGHHRYETALNYRRQLMDKGDLPLDHPAQHVLMMCVGMNDPGMIVLPTHRLFRGLPEHSSAQLRNRLEGCFDVTDVGHGPDLAQMVWDEIDSGGDQGCLGFYTALDGRWTLARLSSVGRRRMAEAAQDHSENWGGLGVSILERLVLNTLLEQTNLPKPMYVHSVEEVRHYLKHGDITGRDATGQEGVGGRFPLAALVMPASVGHVRQISELGERMPAKSTFFYPKLLSGLVFHQLERA